MTCRNTRTIQRALEATGLPHEIRKGSRHQMVYLCGIMIGVFSHGPSKAHDESNIVLKIRQFAKRQQKAKA